MLRFLNLATRPITSAGVLVAQVLYAAHRNDLPSLRNQEVSGTFGDPVRPRLRIVVLGDSSATAPGVVPLDAAWPRRVAADLSGRFHVSLESVAVGGAKASDVIVSQLDVAVALGGDMALMSIGSNDALRGTSVRRFEAEYRRILERLTGHFPMVGVSGVGDLGTIMRLPTLARSIARVRGRSIDHAILRAVRAFPGVVKSETWQGAWKDFERDPYAFAADRFHASAIGHAYFGAGLLSVAEALLESPAGADALSG